MGFGQRFNHRRGKSGAGGGTSVTVSPWLNVLKPYRMVGWPYFGGNQGDTFASDGYWYRMSAPSTGLLTHAISFAQIQRNNTEWGDKHVLGDGGKYMLYVYRYTKATVPNGNIGVAADRTLLGQLKDYWYPGRPDGPAASTWDSQRMVGTKTALEALVTSLNPQGIGNGYFKNSASGVAYQSWDKITDKSQLDSDWVSGTDPDMPTGWDGAQRFDGRGYIRFPIQTKTVDTDGNVTWSLGVSVTMGDVLLFEYRNEHATSSKNYCHDNALHLKYGPHARSDDLYPHPQDKMQGVFLHLSGSDRDQRKTACLTVEIDGTCYGQGSQVSLADSGWPRKGGRNVTTSQWVRQVITPDDQYYPQTCRKIWTWAFKNTQSATGSTAAGILQVAVWRAKKPASGEALVWIDLTGWKDYGGTAFTESPGHPHDQFASKPVTGDVDITSTNVDMVFKNVALDAGVDIEHEPGYHFAIVLRVKSGSAVYGISGLYSASFLYHRNMPSFATVKDSSTTYPTLMKIGGSGDYWNQSEVSTNSSGVTVAVQSSAPSSPVAGKIWYKNSALTPGVFVYDGSNWDEVACTIAATAPTSPVEDDYWFDTTASMLKQLVATTWRSAALTGTWGVLDSNVNVLPLSLEPTS